MTAIKAAKKPDFLCAAAILPDEIWRTRIVAFELEISV